MRGEDEVKALMAAALSRVSEGSAFVSFYGSKVTATRFGENAINQNTSAQEETLLLEVCLGRRKGSAQTTRLDPESLDALVRTATEIARLSPEDPEHMPPPGPQSYARTPCPLRGDVHDTERTADGVARIVDRAKAHRYSASGVFQATSAAIGIANTEGLCGFDRRIDIDWSATVHGPNGSGKAAQNRSDPDQIDPDALAQEAVDGAIAAQNAVAIDPGDYDVVFAPPAAAQLVEYIGYMLSAREAAEGSSPFTGTIDTQHLSEAVTLRLPVDDPELPAPLWGSDGLALTARTWIARGVVKRLCHDRFWADQQSTDPDPAIFPLALDGSDAEIEDLVRDCRRGLLVKNLWYIRFVDPRTLTLTGLTRDGVFRIEEGRVTVPVKNMRWNESPLEMLRNITGLSRAVRVRGMRMPTKAPAIAASNFTFTSVTDSV